MEALPVGKFHGIGPTASANMNALGIFTGKDMRNQTLEFMNANFGKAGAYYYWISRGVDERPVRANRIRKSVGAENISPAISPNSTRRPRNSRPQFLSRRPFDFKRFKRLAERVQPALRAIENLS